MTLGVTRFGQVYFLVQQFYPGAFGSCHTLSYLSSPCSGPAWYVYRFMFLVGSSFLYTSFLASSKSSWSVGDGSTLLGELSGLLVCVEIVITWPKLYCPAPGSVVTRSTTSTARIGHVSPGLSVTGLPNFWREKNLRFS